MRLGNWIVVLAIVFAASQPRALAQERAPKQPLDDAVDRGLQFLARNQDPDGHWSAGYRGRNPAITALSVMAFLSSGHVPGEGRYSETIRRGIDAVIRTQQPNGLIGADAYFEMYQHGICTLMLAEVVGMTDGKQADEVRQRLEKAVQVILRAQRSGGNHRGGWRYRAFQGDDGDISVTGWQLMSLRAAKNVGCDVPPDAIDRAVEFINKCNDPSTGGYRYLPGAHVTAACTGTSVLALELCGKTYHRSPPALKAGSYMLKNPPNRSRGHYFYGIYYCSQAMFQLGDNYWNSYRAILHEQLFTSQANNGSWIGKVSDDVQFGSAYCTAMAILALTVEYRFLPIYQRDEGDADVKKKSP
jgi:hypothetical protein